MAVLDDAKKFIELALDEYATNVLKRENIQAIVTKHKVPWPNWLVTKKYQIRGAGDMYRLPEASTLTEANILADMVGPASPAFNPVFTPTPVPIINPPKPSPVHIAPHEDPTELEPLPTFKATKKVYKLLPGVTMRQNPPATKQVVTVKVGEDLPELPASIAMPIDPSFVQWGPFDELTAILKTGYHCPMYGYGEKGCGKSFLMEQAAALLNRGFLRVQIIKNTDESDLLGALRMHNGSTVFELGPVLLAMLRGDILLLDEVDLGSDSLLCLQPVMEGGGIYVKAINRWVYPAPGFTILGTANTSGSGNTSGRFSGAQVQNTAFLDRFLGGWEIDYPPVDIETEILTKYSKLITGEVDESFVDKLTKWATKIRMTFKTDGSADTMSTRKLRGAVFFWATFGGDQNKAIELVTSQNEQDRNAFRQFWKAL